MTGDDAAGSSSDQQIATGDNIARPSTSQQSVTGGDAMGSLSAQQIVTGAIQRDRHLLFKLVLMKLPQYHLVINLKL